MVEDLLRQLLDVLADGDSEGLRLEDAARLCGWVPAGASVEKAAITVRQQGAEVMELGRTRGWITGTAISVRITELGLKEVSKR